MDILVCIKQVPDDSVEITVDSVSGKISLEGITEVVNAFDTYALEMATRLKEAKGGSICVLSLGEKSVINNLKNCLAVGADEAFYVEDENYQKRETISVSEILKESILKLEERRGKKFDVIFCGKESTDFASGQVGIILGNKLNYPIITNIIDVDIEENSLIAKKETEEGYQKIKAPLPCVLTVNKPNYEPRYPTIKSKMAARKKEVSKIEIEIKKEENFVKIVNEFSPPKRQAGVKLKDGKIEDLVKEAIEKMVETKVL